MEKARTLPSSSYETNLPLQRVMLRHDETHDNSDTPMARFSYQNSTASFVLQV